MFKFIKELFSKGVKIEETANMYIRTEEDVLKDVEKLQYEYIEADTLYKVAFYNALEVMKSKITGDTMQLKQLPNDDESEVVKIYLADVDFDIFAYYKAKKFAEHGHDSNGTYIAFLTKPIKD